MKTTFIKLVPVVALLFAACGNEKQETTSSAVTTDTTVVRDTALTPNFYKRLEGTIADQPVVMHLQCYNGNIQGLYYYQNHGIWLMLGGKLDTAQPNNLAITESDYSNGDAFAHLDCKYENGTLKGTWRSADGKKNYLIDLKEAYPQGAYPFTTLSINDSVPAFEQKANSPKASMSYYTVIPAKEDSDGQWIGGEIKKALGIDPTLLSLDITSAIKKMNGKYAASYREEAKTMATEDLSSFLNYEDLHNVSICYNDNGYVILDANVYAYSGGAHGNGGSSFFCLDVQNKKVLKLSDVISADSTRLQPIVEKAFRKQQGLKPTDSLNTILFENHLATTQNFYYTNKGIGFYYFPYEVAAYAFGPIQVFVPFTDLKQYLKPDFTKRMNLSL